MGGLVSATISGAKSSASPPPPAVPDREAEARAQREEALARNRRGRSGLVATSDRGALDSAPAAPAKTLLGE